MVRVACVGAGFFAAFHYEAWKRIDDVELVGACDQLEERAKATGLPAYVDLNKMLEETTPDLLDVILPPQAHREAILAAINYGVKAVICQKPFCTSIDEAREMVHIAKSAHRLLVVHENFRFQPWYRAAHASIQHGDIGDVQQITFRLRTGDGQGPNAYLDRQPYFQKMQRLLIHETGVHWIDTFCYLMGRPEAVYADLRKLNPAIAGEDAGYFILEFPGQKRALFDGNRLLDHAAVNHWLTLGEAVLEGTEGTLSLNGDGEVSLRGFGKRDEKIILPRQNWQGFGGDCVKALNEHVIRSLLNGAPIENTAEDYLNIIKIKDAIYASAAEGRKLRLEL